MYKDTLYVVTPMWRWLCAHEILWERDLRESVVGDIGRGGGKCVCEGGCSVWSVLGPVHRHQPGCASSKLEEGDVGTWVWCSGVCTGKVLCAKVLLSVHVFCVCTR